LQSFFTLFDLVFVVENIPRIEFRANLQSSFLHTAAKIPISFPVVSACLKLDGNVKEIISGSVGRVEPQQNDNETLVVTPNIMILH
jgi:hypothetical protein